MQAGTSFKDYLSNGEELDEEVVDLCSRLESDGWIVRTRTNRGFRYWCPCPQESNRWIDDRGPMRPQRLEFLFNNTCFTP